MQSSAGLESQALLHGHVVHLRCYGIRRRITEQPFNTCFQCDGNVPCEQCKGVNHKFGSRWYEQPCVRRQNQARVERPLRLDLKLRNTNRVPTDPTSNLSLQSQVAASQVSSPPMAQSILIRHQSHANRPRHSTLIDFAKSPDFRPSPFSTAQTPLPHGTYQFLHNSLTSVPNLSTQSKFYQGIASLLGCNLF